MKIRILSLYLPIILSAALLLSCNSTKGKVATNSGVMYAMIYDYDNVALSGVLIKVNGKEIVRSDVQGRFILDFKRIGEYRIELFKKGYETLIQKFEYNPMNVLYFKMITAQQLLSLAEGELDKFSYEEAEKYLERAYMLEPKRADIIYLRCISLVLQEKYFEARSVFSELMEAGYKSKYIDLLQEKIEKGIMDNN